MRFYSILFVVLSAIFVVGMMGNTSYASDKTHESYTIAELYSKKGELNGKEVVVRGKVVKFNGGIMGKNWIHIQDGTGKKGTNDLTITSHQSVKVGASVVATGTLVKDKDFGGGYQYEIIIDGGSITTE